MFSKCNFSMMKIIMLEIVGGDIMLVCHVLLSVMLVALALCSVCRQIWCGMKSMLTKDSIAEHLDKSCNAEKNLSENL